MAPLMNSIMLYRKTDCSVWRFQSYPQTVQLTWAPTCVHPTPQMFLTDFLCDFPSSGLNLSNVAWFCLVKGWRNCHLWNGVDCHFCTELANLRHPPSRVMTQTLLDFPSIGLNLLKVAWFYLLVNSYLSLKFFLCVHLCHQFNPKLWMTSFVIFQALS